MRKILITGAAGYIGCVLSRVLKDDIIVPLDSCLHGQRDTVFQKRDIRWSEDRGDALEGVQAVVNLAALVGEAACNKSAHNTWKVNHEAAVALAKEAKEAGARRFVQVSTCSNYGICEQAREDSPLNPLSAYALSKVQAEKDILALNSADFRVTVLRLATVYGVSPRMRFDLLINEWVRDALLKGRITLYGPTTVRPYVHVEDVAQAIKLVLIHDAGGEVFNIGGENIAKRDLAMRMQGVLPYTEIENLGDGGDKRDYCVVFDKARDKLGFRPEWTVDMGIDQIARALSFGRFPEPFSQQYRNA